ncbi:hypothetical protein F4859DRAFT_308734 [Xylaria cf. heliscus]|nr:hypothetical protein F4859DRAFT_308734 [Xylaria cf. heliscus]
MRFSPVLAALSFTILVKAQNFSSYVPECAPPCVEQTLNSTKVCTGLDDNKCLCTNFPQIVFSARICFVQTCNNTNVEGLRSEITTGWQKFCNDSGTPVDFTSGWSPGGPESPVSSSSATSSATSSIPPTSSSTSSSAASSASASAVSSDLSTGAKAGIGVGVGVGSLGLISGLVFLGFRLGLQKRKGSRNEEEGTPPFNEGGHPEDGRGTATATLDTTATGTTAEGGGENWAYKVQPEGATLAELPSPDAELSANDVRELPAHEHPVELWHGVMPPELSADAEVPQNRTTRL